MTTITIADLDLRPRTLRSIQLRPKRAGQSPSAFIRAMIERDLLAEKTSGEMLRPVRQDVAKAGITPAAFDRIVDRAKMRFRCKLKSSK